jgi:transcriptional regulator with GAF, ATPase, and Fis domain/tetratricopeptide (TPR) repeat protein
VVWSSRPSEAFAPPTLRGERLEQSGLREVDGLAGDAEAKGFVYVQGAASVLETVARHAERRARALGRPLLKIGGLPTDDAWRELASAAGVGVLSDPVSAARQIAERCGQGLVLVREGTPTCWGSALADALEHLATSAEGHGRSLILVLSERAPARSRVIDVDAVASPEEIRLWWEAIARDADHALTVGLDRLDALEGWWGAARTTPGDRRVDPVVLSASARRLLVRLSLSQRSWSRSEALRFGSGEACDELLARRVLEVDARGRLIASGDAPLPALDEGDRVDALAVAEALDPRPDPWAAARAAELYARAGEGDRAEAAAARALSGFTDPAARSDFRDRWEAALEGLPFADAAPRLLRSADLALRVGDVDSGLRTARKVVARNGDSFDALLMLGRAAAARGDLPTAAHAIGRAMERAGGAELRARAEVEMAEVRYLCGALDEARRHAESGLAAAFEPFTRLQARNVLGKLHLANAAWTEAEEHFAADACEASLTGDVMGELRARLNRAIALLSSGRLHEARSMLGTVLEDGERNGEHRAVAFALANLATIAILQREYPEAIRLSERAFEVRRRIGDKLSLALVITNLSELRLLIGQVPEAEQALAFGRQACGPGIPGTRLAHFAVAAARIHLARGNTLEASAEIHRAIDGASSSRDGNKLCECYRLAARVALDDGDVLRAETALGLAREKASTDLARADIAVLEAMAARARGAPFAVAAREALDLARRAEDAELAREAHLLLHFDAVSTGDGRAARLHLDAALTQRNRIAFSLPDEMRRRFLARRELAELSLLESSFGAAPAESVPRACERCGSAECEGCRNPSLRPERSAASLAPRKIVGRDAAVMALLNAIQKVGPSDATVLIRGESGTGKELVAEAIHEASARRSGPMVKVNCAALVETLLLSELFGHEKGSFTGASARKRGRFEMAEGGTLFLDEIGDISPRTQVALLRVLQEKTFERVGGVSPIHADVRIVCATHRDLKALVQRGEFREDLYYRLRGIVLEVPALRQRLGDLGSIASAILARIASERGAGPRKLSVQALTGLARHPWPGNVRELENALRAAALFAEGDTIELADFTDNVDGLRAIAEEASAPVRLPVPAAPISLGFSAAMSGTDDAIDSFAMAKASGNARSSGEAPPASSPTDVAYAHIRGGVSLSDMKRQIERDCIERALAESGGNITRAALLLGMKRPRLSQLVKQYGFGGDSVGSDVDSEET